MQHITPLPPMSCAWIPITPKTALPHVHVNHSSRNCRAVRNPKPELSATAGLPYPQDLHILLKPGPERLFIPILNPK